MLSDMIAGLPVDQQREVEAQAARLIEEETTLRDLRKAQNPCRLMRVDGENNAADQSKNGRESLFR
jgi:hypothetical protein